MDTRFTQLFTELGVICHIDAFVVYDNTGGCSFDLIGQVSNHLLLLL